MRWTNFAGVCVYTYPNALKRIILRFYSSAKVTPPILTHVSDAYQLVGLNFSNKKGEKRR